MSASTQEVLDRLNVQLSVHVHSTASLVTDVDKAAAAIDRERARKHSDRETGTRKPGLGPLRGGEGSDLSVTPWELLGVFARATTLARQGRGRGLAEQWQALKYCQALAAGASGYLALTEEGQILELSYRGMQARELGRAFGLAVSERAVRSRYPDRLVSVVDAEVALLAGFARSGPRRPWVPGLGPTSSSKPGGRANGLVSS